LALVLEAQGRLDEAHRLLLETLGLRRRVLGAEHPDTLWSMYILGRVLKLQGRLEESREILAQTIQARGRSLGPEHHHTLQAMGELLEVVVQQNRLEDVRELREKVLAGCARAIARDPKITWPLDERAKIYKAVGQLEKAIPDYSKVIEIEPENSSAWSRRAKAYRDLHQYEKAINDYSKAIALNSKAPEPLNDLAQLFSHSMDPRFRNAGKAVGLAKKAVELAPQEANCWNTLGVASYRAGDWKAAISALEKSTKLHKGGDSFDCFFLAMARWQSGDKKEARKLYDLAVQWMEKNQPKNEDLGRFRAEAESLLNIDRKATPK